MRFVTEAKMRPKLRPRFRSGQGAYNDPVYKEDMEALVWDLVAQRKGQFLNGNAEVRIHFGHRITEVEILPDGLFERPKRIHHGADVDNLAGFVLDGITKAGIWDDDRQVTRLEVSMARKAEL